MYLDVCMSRNQEINLNIARMSFLLIFVYKYFIYYYTYNYYLYYTELFKLGIDF